MPHSAIHRGTGDADASARKRYTFWITPELLAALKTIQARDGIPASEQIRRALVLWLEAKGVKLKGA